MSNSKVLFMLTGSIACYKSAYIISRLVQNDFEVQTAATSGALKFIGEATLEGLTGKKVFKDIYEPGQMMNHIDLSKWANISIIAPATAHTLNGLAQGTASEPIGSLFLAYNLEKPLLVAPAMNQEMFRHPATQRAMQTLESWKVRILPTEDGHQACGDIGPGRFLDPDKIYQAIVAAAGEQR